MTGAHQRFGPQNFAEALGEAGRAKNFSEEQKRGARVALPSDNLYGIGKVRVHAELVRASIKPSVHGRVGHAQDGLQVPGIARRIIYQESRKHAEEAGQ
jgi:hypothetical protein